ncbi:MAG: PHP domain-containing protein [Bdellovibrionota bacterium]
MFLADFHVHTNRSDGKVPLKEVVDLYGEHGFGAIAITDHLCDQKSVLGKASRFLGYSLNEENFAAHMEDLKSEAERAWKQYRMILLPGFEVTKNSISNARSSHMLAVGTDKYVDPNLNTEDTCAAIRAQGALAIAAHPVFSRKMEKQTYFLWDRREELKNHFDAWEVASGPHLFPEVMKSGLPMIASSDLHHKRQLTSWKTVLRCERNAEAILDAIRRQDIEFAFYRAESFTAERGFLASSLRGAFPQLQF